MEKDEDLKDWEDLKRMGLVETGPAAANGIANLGKLPRLYKKYKNLTGNVNTLLNAATIDDITVPISQITETGLDFFKDAYEILPSVGPALKQVMEFLYYANPRGTPKGKMIDAAFGSLENVGQQFLKPLPKFHRNHPNWIKLNGNLKLLGDLKALLSNVYDRFNRGWERKIFRFKQAAKLPTKKFKTFLNRAGDVIFQRDNKLYYFYKNNLLNYTPKAKERLLVLENLANIKNRRNKLNVLGDAFGNRYTFEGDRIIKIWDGRKGARRQQMVGQTVPELFNINEKNKNWQQHVSDVRKFFEKVASAIYGENLSTVKANEFEREYYRLLGDIIERVGNNHRLTINAMENVIDHALTSGVKPEDISRILTPNSNLDVIFQQLADSFGIKPMRTSITEDFDVILGNSGKTIKSLFEYVPNLTTDLGTSTAFTLIGTGGLLAIDHMGGPNLDKYIPADRIMDIVANLATMGLGIIASELTKTGAGAVKKLFLRNKDNISKKAIVGATLDWINDEIKDIDNLLKEHEERLEEFEKAKNQPRIEFNVDGPVLRDESGASTPLTWYSASEGEESKQQIPNILGIPDQPVSIFSESFPLPKEVRKPQRRISAPLAPAREALQVNLNSDIEMEPSSNGFEVEPEESFKEITFKNGQLYYGGWKVKNGRGQLNGSISKNKVIKNRIADYVQENKLDNYYGLFNIEAPPVDFYMEERDLVLKNTFAPGEFDAEFESVYYELPDQNWNNLSNNDNLPSLHRSDAFSMETLDQKIDGALHRAPTPPNIVTDMFSDLRMQDALDQAASNAGKHLTIKEHKKYMDIWRKDPDASTAQSAWETFFGSKKKLPSRPEDVSPLRIDDFEEVYVGNEKDRLIDEDDDRPYVHNIGDDDLNPQDELDPNDPRFQNDPFTEVWNNYMDVADAYSGLDTSKVRAVGAWIGRHLDTIKKVVQGAQTVGAIWGLVSAIKRFKRNREFSKIVDDINSVIGKKAPSEPLSNSVRRRLINKLNDIFVEKPQYRDKTMRKTPINSKYDGGRTLGIVPQKYLGNYFERVYQAKMNDELPKNPAEQTSVIVGHQEPELVDTTIMDVKTDAPLQMSATEQIILNNDPVELDGESAVSAPSAIKVPEEVKETEIEIKPEPVPIITEPEDPEPIPAAPVPESKIIQSDIDMTLLPVKGNSKVRRCSVCNTFVSKDKPHSASECRSRAAKFAANRGKGKRKTRKSDASRKMAKLVKQKRFKKLPKDIKDYLRKNFLQ